MRDGFDTPETEESGPEDLVIRAFSRCQNYPKDRAGVLGLAQGLRAAADRFGVEMSAIIAECVESSTFCPTDHDLLEVARALKAGNDDVPPWKRPTQCNLCGDTGWKPIRKGNYDYVERCDHKGTV